MSNLKTIKAMSNEFHKAWLSLFCTYLIVNFWQYLFLRFKSPKNLFSYDLFNVYNIFWFLTVFFYRQCSRHSEIFIPKAYSFFGIVHKNFSEFSTKRVRIPFCPKNLLKISTDSYSAFCQKNCPQTAYLSHLRAKYLFSKGKMVHLTGVEPATFRVGVSYNAFRNFSYRAVNLRI